MKNPSFARNRLNALLRTQACGAVGAIVPRITDLFVAGNVVGVDALTAIAAIMPVTIGALFVGKLAYCGSGYLFAKYQGEFRRDRAARSSACRWNSRRLWGSASGRRCSLDGISTSI